MTPPAQAPGRRRPAIGAQPGLPIVLPASGPPGRLVGEVSTPCARAFDGDDWLFSVDWEGSRCLVIADGTGSVRLAGEAADLGDRFPELVDAARQGLSRPAVLDGSICILDREGRPDLVRLWHRVMEGRDHPLAVYLVTDLLHLDGESLSDRPLAARLEALAPVVPADSRIQLPDLVAGHGRALAAAAAERGLSAMLARRRDARYHAGAASPDRLRIALCGRRDAVVVGWRTVGAAFRVLLADWVSGRLALVGVTSVEASAAKRWLAANADVSPHDVALDDPDAAGPGVTWVRPRLVATVEPASVRRPHGLPVSTLIALRDDVDPMWCVRRLPVEPPRATSLQPLHPFSPTVLSALPI